MVNAWLDFVHNFRMQHGNTPLKEIAKSYHSGRGGALVPSFLMQKRGHGLVGGCGDGYGLMGRGLVGGAYDEKGIPIASPITPQAPKGKPRKRQIVVAEPKPARKRPVVEDMPAPAPVGKPRKRQIAVKPRGRPIVEALIAHPVRPARKKVVRGRQYKKGDTFDVINPAFLNARPPRKVNPNAKKRLTKAQRAYHKLHPELSAEEALAQYLEEKLAKRLARQKDKQDKKYKPGYRRTDTVCDIRIALVQKGVMPSELYHDAVRQVRHKNGTTSTKNVKIPLKRPELLKMLAEVDAERQVQDYGREMHYL